MTYPDALRAFVWTFAAAWASAAADDEGGFWPGFHGPNHDNMSAETRLLAKWPVGGPPLAWRFGECGEGYAGISIAGGRIFTAGDFDAKEFVLCLDLAGKLLWKAENGRSWRGSAPGARRFARQARPQGQHHREPLRAPRRQQGRHARPPGRVRGKAVPAARAESVRVRRQA